MRTPNSKAPEIKPDSNSFQSILCVSLMLQNKRNKLYCYFLSYSLITFLKTSYFLFSDRGICLPTVSLWLLFVYIEASVRLRELKNIPFNLDLCRPFAAHW